MPTSFSAKRQLRKDNPYKQSFLQKKIWGKNQYKVLLTNRDKAANPMKGKPTRTNFIEKTTERDTKYHMKKQKDSEEYQKSRTQKKAVVNDIKSKKFTRLFDRLK